VTFGHTPDVGEIAPDCTCVDHAGNAVTLARLAAVGPLVLVFYRGFW
jgi:peroxiredoxin